MYRAVVQVDRNNRTETKPLYFFFFSSRRRHTRLQGDWSSDVCSSDLFPLRSTRVKLKLLSTSASSAAPADATRSEEHTSELQSPCNLVCRLLLEKKKKQLLFDPHTAALQAGRWVISRTGASNLRGHT